MSEQTEEHERRPAKCLATSGGYFRGWSRKKPLTTFRIREARLFFSDFDLAEEVRKLERRGLTAEVVPVMLKIGA